ncbi:hypothetical protein RRG08_026204 [Elysia crispata]|uniref:Uncharacterized protein n=1 Tax=Elysia crispata TaxID=231223 RepID=A0AAE1DDT6_9GAST|nr:hypothetical protein RRG08_026204 [Elysia crispata]
MHRQNCRPHERTSSQTSSKISQISSNVYEYSKPEFSNGIFPRSFSEAITIIATTFKILVLYKLSQARTSSRQTSLYRACRSKLSEPRLVQFLLKKGANVNKAVSGDWSPLATACYYNKVNLIETLIQHGASTTQKNGQGHTPLSIAVCKKHTDICRLLLDNRAPVDDSTGCGFSPLMFSAQYGHKEIATLLLKAGANVHKKNRQGFTPLMLAAQNGHAQLVKIFLVHDRVCINAYNNKRFNAVLIAAYNGHLEVLKVLFFHMGQEIPSFHAGGSPLMLAVEAGHTQVVEYLLSDSPIPEDIADRQVVTAFYLSLQNRNEEMTYLLSKTRAVMENYSALDAKSSSVSEMKMTSSAPTNIVEKHEKYESSSSQTAQSEDCPQGEIFTSHGRKREVEETYSITTSERSEIKSTMTDAAARVSPTHSAVAWPCLPSDACSSHPTLSITEEARVSSTNTAASCKDSSSSVILSQPKSIVTERQTKDPKILTNNLVATASSAALPVSNISNPTATLARGMSEGHTLSNKNPAVMNHSLSAPANINAFCTEILKTLPQDQRLTFNLNIYDQRNYNFDETETVSFGTTNIINGSGSNPRAPNDDSDEDNVK